LSSTFSNSSPTILPELKSKFYARARGYNLFRSIN
jgi:hypothetical protein